MPANCHVEPLGASGCGFHREALADQPGAYGPADLRLIVDDEHARPRHYGLAASILRGIAHSPASGSTLSVPPAAPTPDSSSGRPPCGPSDGIGSVHTMVVPTPSWLSAQMRPPCAWMMLAQIAKPS